MSRTVVFLDILGFRKLIEEFPTEQLGQRFSQAMSLAVDFNKNAGKTFFPSEPTLFPTLSADQPYCITHVFSDSIVSISHNESSESCLAALVYNLHLMQFLLGLGFPTRGAAAFGPMYVDEAKSLFLGKALTQAYEFEQKQEWIGAALHDSIEEAFPDLFGDEHPFATVIGALFPPYCVPLKQGNIKEIRSVNWRWNLVVPKGTRGLLPSCQDWSAKRKQENALAYAQFIRANGLAYPNDQSKIPIEVRSLYLADGPPTAQPPSHGDEL
jgi:hypothetical protein